MSRYTERVVVPMTTEMKNKIKELAEAEDRPVAQIIRHLIDHALDHKTTE